MGITVTGLKHVKIGSVDAVSSDFADAASYFGSGEDSFGADVADRIGSGDIWDGGGQPDAETVMQINLGALAIGRIEMEAAQTTLDAFYAAIGTAQSSLQKSLDDAESKDIGVYDDGFAYQKHGATDYGNADTSRLEREIKGVLVFAGLADASCKGLLDSIASHAPTYSATADDQALAHNSDMLLAALSDRDLAVTNKEFWEAATPQPLPEEPGLLEEALDGVGSFFSYLWDNAGDISRLLLHSTEVAGGALLILLGATGEVGGVALDATGVGTVVGVPVGIASAGAIVAGIAAVGLGLEQAKGDIDKLSSEGSSGSSASGSTQAEPPTKASDTLKWIDEHNGAPPKGYKGGKPYENVPKQKGDEKLPETNAEDRSISYKEYDVDPKVKGQPRNTDRLVIGETHTYATDSSGETVVESTAEEGVYYTNDHYKTFIQIR